MQDGKQVRMALLSWYGTNRRQLPWRQTNDPYRVWISEVMLQQTRVDAVIPYYERWIAAFPDVSTLASSDLHDVLRHWEGLGYYSRARNLHGAARLVREKHGGTMPRDCASLRALPGVGAYTAGAIASIAYNHPTPAIDGNVRRVIARLFDKSNPSPAKVNEHVEQLIDPARPGDFNQALMDLGATVCTPRTPRCDRCPLNGFCLAAARGTVAKRPAPKQKKTPPHFRVTTLIQLRKHEVILEQRATSGLLGGLWQFPETVEPPPHARVLGEVTHVFSHKRITYVVVAADAPSRLKSGQRWVRLDQTSAYPMSAAQRKIERMIGLTGAAAMISIES